MQRRSAPGSRSSRASATIAAEPSTAITRPSRQPIEQHRGHPPAPAAGVEDGLVAAQAEPVDDRPRPIPAAASRRGRRSPRPSPGCPATVHRYSDVVGCPERRVSLLVGVDRLDRLQRDRDLVVAAEQAVLDLLLDLEADHAAGVVDRLVVEVDPDHARLGDRRGNARAGGSPAGSRSWSSSSRRCPRTRARSQPRSRSRPAPRPRARARSPTRSSARRRAPGSARARSRRRGASRRTGTRRSRSARSASGTAWG